MRRSLIVSLVAAAAAVVPVGAASAKSVSLAPMPCSGASTAQMMFLRQGSVYSLGMRGTSTPVGAWRTSVVIDGTRVIFDDTFGPEGSGGFNITAPGVQVAKTERVAVLTASNSVTGEVCTASLGLQRV